MKTELVCRIWTGRLRKALVRMGKAQAGAVTVDWVVITAGVVGLAATIQVFINPIIVGEHGRSVNAGVHASVQTGLSGSHLGN
jgi:hypothetical protein